ncbi:hypothetical protein [Haloarcula marina]|uniref:hypothetical protein n=1 Tax=Haloarcula marina TaxID=2961574 RepID=UPI0020B8E89E|nr:hypothetical protein [Halomicroarcula marina]
MPSQPPFVDPVTNELDTDQILAEAIPLAKLVGVFVAVALVPLGLGFFALGNSAIGAILALLGQFVLAVGTGVVLLYVVARGRQLSSE